MLAPDGQHHGEWFTDNKGAETDPLTNSLFIEAQPDVLSRAEAWLAQMDQPRSSRCRLQRILCPARREGLHELGLQWGTVLPSPESRQPPAAASGAEITRSPLISPVSAASAGMELERAGAGTAAGYCRQPAPDHGARASRQYQTRGGNSVHHAKP